MSTGFYVGAYWRPRREPDATCARRAVRFLKALASVDPFFSKWFEKDCTLEGAVSREIELSESALRTIFSAGVSRRDSDKSVIEDLGFRLSAWTGRGSGKDDATLWIACGCYSSHMPTPNHVIIDFSQGTAGAGGVLTVPTLSGVIRLLAECWDPDWATVNSDQFRDLADLPTAGIQVGWMTYVSSKRASMPPIPSPSRCVQVDRLGAIAIVTDEVFSADNPMHVEQAMKIIEEMKQVRLVRRHEVTTHSRPILCAVVDACTQFLESRCSLSDVNTAVAGAIRSLDFEDPFRDTLNKFSANLSECNYIYDDEARRIRVREKIEPFLDVLGKLGLR